MHKEFCNNFNTPGVIQLLDDLMTALNTYKMETKPKYNIINGIFNYLNKIFKVIIINTYNQTYIKKIINLYIGIRNKLLK